MTDVVVPGAVWEEVTVRGAGQPGANETIQAHRKGWLQRQAIHDVLAVVVLQATLGPGESEAIILAQEVNARWVLLDDDLARAHAKHIQLSPKGTAGILLAAWQAGLLDDLRGTLDELRTQGFWLSDRVYDAVLRMAGIGSRQRVHTVGGSHEPSSCRHFHADRAGRVVVCITGVQPEP